MKKITLKLSDCYNLESEINGLTNQRTGEKVVTGLLQHKLPLSTKYWLTDLAKKLAPDKAFIDEAKNDLIKKLGEEDADGNVTIPMFLSNGNSASVASGPPPINPKFREFEQEYTNILQTEKELEYHPFKLEDFSGIESTDNYATLFKLFEES